MVNSIVDNEGNDGNGSSSNNNNNNRHHHGLLQELASSILLLVLSMCAFIRRSMDLYCTMLLWWTAMLSKFYRFDDTDLDVLAEFSRLLSINFERKNEWAQMWIITNRRNLADATINVLDIGYTSQVTYLEERYREDTKRWSGRGGGRALCVQRCDNRSVPKREREYRWE